jgi:hypothetical protein
VHRNQILGIWYEAINFNPEWFNLSQLEFDDLSQYFYATELMIRCKEAAVRVTPKIWKEIESRILTMPKYED